MAEIGGVGERNPLGYFREVLTTFVWCILSSTLLGLDPARGGEEYRHLSN